ncbi:MAG: M48 family metallopeptidase [Flavobacteriia bacterium]|nr:M48 family metallopeptidase [Flavobacteriia bacterium]OIP48476.1 MAG: peptidase M48 [Flavobacteriaceae bacterium CG2_30_31_66]PIV97575.1 MAG: peptidase M48 [Flavobacteriaceae bacterium CG17_big_fil_post_rev_8_21_14_2_50_31_13]PIX13124.1 MAG: peptidase M48 [Flavobacteriaceae bacterium CG_4_8_14_3_um_filter_31_8]PIY14324.1 MAG: peptidase M48 [Flavobacteriaceae bacterium CG_4_10_14_3_um_filter_31_253]PIZ10194.1 MAG: peptidase M48 [Flavobacteriaceae bacterium CG_4_10_14_0_8_um_filter_31_99]PJC
MNSTILFYIIISILLFDFLFDSYLTFLNNKHFDDKIPKKLADVYDEEAYKKSQAYKKENAKFSTITSLFSISVTLLFFFLEGFKLLDDFARSFTNNPILVALIFFGIMMFGFDILSTPFSYYKTFVIEEEFGFNKTTKIIFWTDKLKGWLMSIVLGGGILSIVILFYQYNADYFWIYTWILIVVFSVFMNLFYAKLIVPIFNKQTPLEDGELKTAIENYAQKVGFKLQNIFVIDGSKRSTKANAYFSGFGSQKRITLYDTLINDLETDEIVAVLAHEVGHYKRKHIIFNMTISLILTGFMLYLVSIFISSPLLSNAMSVTIPSFHIGLIAFGILYSPISEITGLLMNIVSRKFEYQADNYAKDTFDGKFLVSSLKKLSKNSLSNLTPHPAYVFVHYSHPRLLQRIENLES